MTFKVGDKVLIISNDYGDDVPVGTLGTVTKYDGYTYMVSNNDWMGNHDVDEQGNFHLCFLESELESVA